MLKIGLSSCGFEINRENLTKIKNAGIENFEISLPYHKHLEADYSYIKSCADDTGVNIWSCHLPFWGPETMDIASADEEIRERSVAILTDRIKKGGEVGIDKYILHPSSEPKCQEGEGREREIDASMRSLYTLAEVACAHGAVIAVEDLPRSCIGRSADEMLRLLSANDKLRVCLDFNHLLIDTNENFIEKLGDKIITVHVSDYDFINERHWLPGEGKSDWHELYNKLVSKGYDGIWLYEVAWKAPANIIRPRDLTPEDFYTNAMEIFNSSHLTVIGTPNV